MAQLVKNLPADSNPESGFDPWVGKIPWRRERLPTPVESDITERLSLSWI